MNKTHSLLEVPNVKSPKRSESLSELLLQEKDVNVYLVALTVLWFCFKWALRFHLLN